MFRSVLLATSLTTSSFALADVPAVVTDIPPVHSLVAQVMMGVGEPTLILDQGGSAHDFALRPSQARSLSSADLVVWIGPELNPAFGRNIQSLAAQAAQLGLLAADGTHRLAFRELETLGSIGDDHSHGHEHEDHKDHDHENAGDTVESDHGHDKDHDPKHDDDHGHAHEEDHADDHGHAHDATGTDPHAWLDPDNSALWLVLIADALSGIDPDNADTYSANAQQARESLSQIRSNAQTLLAPVLGQPLAVYHDAFHYFEESFGLTVIGAISDSDATAPGPAHLDALRTQLNDKPPVCFLTEPGANPGLVAAVSQNIPVAELDPLGTSLVPGPDLYAALLTDLATRLADCVTAG